MIALLKSLRVHGQGSDKYDNVRIGMNGRLDTMQAAVLLEKLKIFGDELVARQKVADRYNDGLRDVIKVPELDKGATSAWAQYTLTLKPGQNRAAVMDACKAAGVPTMVYYPIPLSQQQGYKHYPSVPGGVPVSERLAQAVFSLPMHPYLDTETQDYIIGVVRDAVAG
jgi:dTDP-4-amino-4,6-dideoxygalactose transaminase